MNEHCNEHLPPLCIPPDHPLAVKLYDASVKQHALILAQAQALESGNYLEARRIVAGIEPYNEKIEEIAAQYRLEVGAPEGRKVSFTFRDRLPVVEGRPGAPTKH